MYLAFRIVLGIIIVVSAIGVMGERDKDKQFNIIVVFLATVIALLVLRLND